MRCDFQFTGRKKGERFVHRCKRCEREVVGKYQDKAPKANCPVAPKAGESPRRPLPPPYGLGTELTALFKELSIKPKKSCGCAAKAAQMDRWGIAGCEEHRGEILAWMQEAYEGISFHEWMMTGAKLLATAWFNPLHPFRSILDEAIRRATVKAAWQPLRNCIYHVAPLAGNDLWLKNVRQLVKRSSVFNGKRVAAIATGEGMLPPAAVHEAFAGLGFTFLEVPNDKQLREVASFLPLLQSIASVNPDEVFFYAHTKGNGTAQNVQGARRWANAMYHFLLDDWEAVRRFLLTSPMAGTHKMTWGTKSPYPSRLQHGNWMFSGTFFWGRHDKVFSHPKWAEIPQDRYGAEAWPSGLFDAKDVASLYQPWGPNERNPNPYDPNLYGAEFDDA